MNLQAMVVGSLLVLYGCGDSTSHEVAPNGPEAVDMPKKVEITLLGNPISSTASASSTVPYIRNIWDMQLWDNKIYIGYGRNSNKIAPSFSPYGPVSIIFYDLQTGHFETEFKVDENQIDRYRIVDGNLCIPGREFIVDKSSSGNSNFYRRNRDRWEKISSIPLGFHVLDIQGYQGALFVAEKNLNEVARVSRSIDGGQTWKQFYQEGTMTSELFMVEGDFYAYTVGKYNFAQRYSIYQYKNDSFEPTQVELFPEALLGPPTPLQLVRSTYFDETLLYIGAEDIDNIEWVPFAAYKALQINQVQRIDLPAIDVPYDITVRNGKVYILTNRFFPGSPEVTVVIYGSEDLVSWREIAQFNMPSLVRSFEYHEGSFYIGLGTLPSPHQNIASGDIYRVTLKVVWVVKTKIGLV